MATETKLITGESSVNMSEAFRENQSFKELLDITFHNIGYSKSEKGNETKIILREISGSFKSGQLTAILGPSGAGKTTLMNILSGLETSGFEGRVNINGVNRDLKEFRKQSAYITQKDYLVPQITVEEYMLSAAHLKLGNEVALKKKKQTIDMILETLGLMLTKQTRVSRLSGGECKRLSIALELIDNPAVLFLDEPTSGLDSSSSLQCVSLLQKIARSGRTVITTIHQPSSRLLGHFDHLYFLADGLCIYQGSVKSLVPYFKSLNLICPSYHNPVDFAMDVACGEYGNVQAELVAAIENGQIIHSETTTTIIATFDNERNVVKLDKSSKTKSNKKNNEKAYAAAFHTQLQILLARTWRANIRDIYLTWSRLIMHIIVGIALGTMYWGIGNEALSINFNTTFLMFSLIFIAFCSAAPTAVTFPLDKKVLIREQLNNWYSLKSYYIAKTVIDIPLLILCTTIFITIVYLMTNQPLDVERFFMLLIVSILTALTGHSIGLLVGAAFSLRVAALVGPSLILPFVLVSGFLVTYGAMPTFMYWLSFTSFTRYAFEATMITIYGYDRPPLDCSVPYCFFRNPQDLLELFDIHGDPYLRSIIGLLVIVITLQVATYFVLRLKLRRAR